MKLRLRAQWLAIKTGIRLAMFLAKLTLAILFWLTAKVIDRKL